MPSELLTGRWPIRVVYSSKKIKRHSVGEKGNFIAKPPTTVFNSSCNNRYCFYRIDLSMSNIFLNILTYILLNRLIACTKTNDNVQNVVKKLGKSAFYVGSPKNRLISVFAQTFSNNRSTVKGLELKLAINVCILDLHNARTILYDTNNPRKQSVNKVYTYAKQIQRVVSCNEKKSPYIYYTVITVVMYAIRTRTSSQTARCYYCYCASGKLSNLSGEDVISAVSRVLVCYCRDTKCVFAKIFV